MNDVTKTYINILNLTWESPALLWTFKLLMRVDETKNFLNACCSVDLHQVCANMLIIHHVRYKNYLQNN